MLVVVFSAEEVLHEEVLEMPLTPDRGPPDLSSKGSAIDRVDWLTRGHMFFFMVFFIFSSASASAWRMPLISLMPFFMISLGSVSSFVTGGAFPLSVTDEGFIFDVCWSGFTAYRTSARASPGSTAEARAESGANRVSARAPFAVGTDASRGVGPEYEVLLVVAASTTFVTGGVSARQPSSEGTSMAPLTPWLPSAFIVFFIAWPVEPKMGPLYVLAVR